jgi:hypothetical protein
VSHSGDFDIVMVEGKQIPSPTTVQAATQQGMRPLPDDHFPRPEAGVALDSPTRDRSFGDDNDSECGSGSNHSSSEPGLHTDFQTSSEGSFRGDKDGDVRQYSLWDELAERSIGGD